MQRNVEQSALTPRQALAELIKKTGKDCILSPADITAQLTEAIEKMTDDKIDVPDKEGNSLLSISVSSRNLIAVKLLLNQFAIEQKDIINTLFNPTLFLFTKEEKKQIQCKKDFVTTQHGLVAILLDQLPSSNQKELFDRAIQGCYCFIFDCLVRHFKKLNQLKSIFEDNEDGLYARFFTKAIAHDNLDAISYATNHSKAIKNHESNKEIIGVDYRYHQPWYNSKTCTVDFYKTYDMTDSYAHIKNKDLILYYFQKKPVNEKRIRIAELLVSFGWHEHTIRAIAAAHQYNHITLSTAKRLVKAYPSRFTPADVFYIVYMGMTDVINNANLVPDDLINSTFLDQSLLVVAADRNDIDMVRALLVRGASINITTGSFLNKRKLSPALLSAIRQVNIPLIKLLLQHGAILDNDTLGLTAIKSANKIVEAFLLAYLHIKYNTKDNRHFNITSDQSKLDLYRIFENSPAMRESVLALLPPHLQQIVVAKQDLAEQPTTDTSISTEETSLSSPAVSSSSVNLTYTSPAERRQLLIDAIRTTTPGCDLSEDDIIKKLNAAYLECTDINTPNEEGDTPFFVALKSQNKIAIKWLIQKKYLGEQLEAFENYSALISSFSEYKADIAFEATAMLLEGPLKEKFNSRLDDLETLYFNLFAVCVRSNHVSNAIKVAELIASLNISHNKTKSKDPNAHHDKLTEIKYILNKLKAKRIESKPANEIMGGILKLIDEDKIKKYSLKAFWSTFTSEDLRDCAANEQNNLLRLFLRSNSPSSSNVRDILLTGAEYGNMKLIKFAIGYLFCHYDVVGYQFYSVNPDFNQDLLNRLPSSTDQENLKERLQHYLNAATALWKTPEDLLRFFKLIDDRDKESFYEWIGWKKIDTTEFKPFLPKKMVTISPSAPGSSASSSNYTRQLKASAPVEEKPLVYSDDVIASALQGEIQSPLLPLSANPSVYTSASAIPFTASVLELNQSEEGQPNMSYAVSSSLAVSSGDDDVANAMSASIIDSSSYPPAPVSAPQHSTGEFDMNQWKLYPPVNIEQSTSEKASCLSDYLIEADDFSIQYDDFATEHEEKTNDAIIFAPSTYSPTMFQIPKPQQDSDLIAFYESLIELSNDERFNDSAEGRESAERLMTFAADELWKIKRASEPSMR